MVDIIKKKVGRPRKEKEIETISFKGRRGRPKKSTEILEKRRTIGFKDLYANEKKEIQKKTTAMKIIAPDEKKSFEELKNIKNIDEVKIELSPQIKRYIADEALRMDKEQDTVPKDIRIEEFEQTSSSEELIKKRQNITMNRFQDGNKAGPGRPKGSRNKITVALEMIGNENAEVVYQQLVDLALGRTKEGDINACKIILDRVYPPRKVNKYDLGYEGIMNTVQDVNALSKHVLKMVVNGEISTEEAEAYGKIIEQRLKIIIDTDMAAKIESTCHKVDLIRQGV